MKDKTNILIKHELYCAGHMIEAAVEYYKASGKDKFLKVMCKYADHIDSIIRYYRTEKAAEEAKADIKECYLEVFGKELKVEEE